MENYLKEINAVLGVAGSFICLTDGRIAASALPDQFDASSVNATAHVASQTFQALETTGQRVNEVDLVYDKGRLIVKNLRGGALAILCSRSVSLPLLNLTANVVVKKLTTELKPPKSSAPAPAARPVPAPAAKPIAPPAAAAEPAHRA